MYALVKRYNAFGVEGLGSRRQHNTGKQPIIGDIDQAQFWLVWQQSAPDGGFWNGRKVADWLTSLTAQKISRQRGWEILRQMTFRLRVPSPSNTESDQIEQEAWKKN